MTTPDLWVEATRDIEAENESRRVAYVATAAADVWPFLAAAQSRPEYVSRKALAAERIDAAVEVVAERGTGAFERLREHLVAQLDADFDALYDSPQRVAARQHEEMRRASQMIGAEIMRRETAPGFGKTAGRVHNAGGCAGPIGADGVCRSCGQKPPESDIRETKSGSVHTAADWKTVTVDADSLADAVAKVKAEHDDVGVVGQQRKVGDGKVEVKYLAKTAGEYGGGSPKSGDKATCHKDDLPIQFFDGQWMHLSGGPSHNDVYPATPRERAEKQGARIAANTYVCLYKGQRKEVQAETTYEAQKKAAAEFGAKKTFEVDVMLAQKDGKDVVHDPARLGALIDSITDDDIRAFAITLGDMDDKPYAATCPNKSCDNHGTAFVHDDLASDNSGDDETAHCPDCDTPLVFEQRKQGAGRRNDFSLSDAKNEAGEWTMSPEQIRAEQAADDQDDYDPYGDDDDYRGRGGRGRRGSRHPFVRNAARDIHDLRRDVGEAMKRYLHPDFHADGQAVLDRTHDAVLDHLADMYGWTVENAQSHKEHHDKVADSVAAHVYETAPFTEHAPPRHHTAAGQGSGWGAHKIGEPVRHIHEVNEGDLLAEDNKQFGAKNMLRVTHVDRDRGVLHGHFVDPADPTKKRMADDRDLAVWDFDLAQGNHHKVGAKTATDDGSRMMRCPNCKTVWRGDDGDKCTCGTTMVRRDASLHTAEEHGGYHLEQADGGWFVVNHIGERKNKEPMGHDEALKYQRALMVNVPGAKEDAERHEKNSMVLHPAKADGAHISAFAIACGDWDDWGERFTRVAAAGRCKGCGKKIETHGYADVCDDCARKGIANPKRTRVSCKKCVAGHDPSGGDCDYCDGQGSLDLTLAMVKAADGWDQGITREAFVRTAMDVACPDCGGTGSVPAGGWEPADQVDNGHTRCGTCGGTGMVPYDAPRGMESQTGEFDHHAHLTRSGEGPARPAGDSRHFHTIEPEGDRWHIYRMPRSQVGQGRGRNKVRISTHDTHEQAVAELNRLKGNVTAVNTDATGADRYNRTPAPRVPDWISQWSDDETRADTSQSNEGRAGAPSANPVKNHAIEEPNSRYVYKPVAAKVGWLDFTSAQQMLGQLDGRDVALTYDDDFGLTTAVGRLATTGNSVTVISANGKTVTVPVQHVLNVAATGYSTANPAAGQADHEPGLMDQLVHTWPSGAMASRKQANPYSPNLNPYTTDGPGQPDQGGTPGDSGGAGATPSDPGQGSGQNPTTTRPRVKPSTDYSDGGGGGDSTFSTQPQPGSTPGWDSDSGGTGSTAPWRAAASLREAEEWYASPVRQRVASKAKAIADTIQGSNPGMGRGQALGFAVETIRAFPRVVGGVNPSALGGVLDRYLMELSQA